jgi:hypothetical protein
VLVHDLRRTTGGEAEDEGPVGSWVEGCDAFWEVSADVADMALNRLLRIM